MERRAGLGAASLIGIPIVANAIWLLPEITVVVPSNNDDAFHWAFVRRGIEALSSGENVLDFWVPQIGLGFPQFLYYQHLPHLFVILLDRALFGAVDPYLLFNLVRYVLLVAFPLTVYWSLRRMDVARAPAVVAAAASSLLSSDHLYGLDYDSYVWRGFGMYTQLWAMHLTFISMALLWRYAMKRRGLVVTVLALSALALSHLLYAYMMVFTAALLLLFVSTRTNAARQIARFAGVGLLVAGVCAYMWIPAIRTGPAFVGMSPYLQSWKYDSFGAPQVLEWLVTGRLFDAGRLPVVTLLVFLGVVEAIRTRSRPALFFVALFAMWLVFFFGRPTLGRLADLLPLSSSLFFHRFVGGVDLAVMPLAGLGGLFCLRLVERLPRPTARTLAAASLAGLLLAPALRERADYYSANTTWMRQTADAIARDGDAAAVLARAAQGGGARVYAGLRSNWGNELDFGIPFRSVKLSNVLTFDGIPEIASPYAGPSVISDLLYDFDDSRLDEYQLLDVRYVIAPAGRPMPAFLRPVYRTPRYVLYEAPTSGIARYVAISERRAVRTQAELFPLNRAWFRAPLAGARAYIRYDYPAAASAVAPGSSGCVDGRAQYERILPSRIELIEECADAGTLAIKVTYHPGWRVTIDGTEVTPFMVSPSYLGVEMPAGRHFVTAEYRSAPDKPVLLLIGALTLVGTLIAQRSLARRRRTAS